MGAVGASAPTGFESVGASTQNFGQNFHTSINFHRIDKENAMNLVTLSQKVISSTHSLKFLMGALLTYKNHSIKTSNGATILFFFISLFRK